MKAKVKPTDESILERAKRLTSTARADALVGEILSRYVQDARFLHVAMGILHNHENAEDAVSDAIALALRKWRQFRGDAKFSTWFTRIVITCSLMAKRNLPDTVPDIPERAAPQTLDDDIYQREIRGMLHAAIDELESPRERAILKMRVEQELPFKEVARRLGIPLGTVKNLALAAYRRLGAKLSPEGDHRNSVGSQR